MLYTALNHVFACRHYTLYRNAGCSLCEKGRFGRIKWREGRERAERALPIYGIDRGVGEQSGIIRIFHRDKDISSAKGVSIA